MEIAHLRQPSRVDLYDHADASECGIFLIVVLDLRQRVTPAEYCKLLETYRVRYNIPIGDEDLKMRRYQLW